MSGLITPGTALITPDINVAYLRLFGSAIEGCVGVF
jgi:hypothetical protein